MNTVAILETLNRWQAGIEVKQPEAPRAAGVARVYFAAPDFKDAVTDLPCWINEFIYTGETKGVSLQEHQATIHSQLLVTRQISDSGFRTAQAFLDEIVNSWQTRLTWDRQVTQVNLRGEAPTVTAMQRGSTTYIGVGIFWDIVFEDDVIFADQDI